MARAEWLNSPWYTHREENTTVTEDTEINLYELLVQTRENIGLGFRRNMCQAITSVWGFDLGFFFRAGVC